MLHYRYFVTALKIIIYNNIVCLLFKNTDGVSLTKRSLITVCGNDGQYCFPVSFFSVRTITYEPLPLA